MKTKMLFLSAMIVFLFVRCTNNLSRNPYEAKPILFPEGPDSTFVAGKTMNIIYNPYNPASKFKNSDHLYIMTEIVTQKGTENRRYLMQEKYEDGFKLFKVKLEIPADAINIQVTVQPKYMYKSEERINTVVTKDDNFVEYSIPYFESRSNKYDAELFDEDKLVSPNCYQRHYTYWYYLMQNRNKNVVKREIDSLDNLINKSNEDLNIKLNAYALLAFGSLITKDSTKLINYLEFIKKNINNDFKPDPFFVRNLYDLLYYSNKEKAHLWDNNFSFIINKNIFQILTHCDVHSTLPYFHEEVNLELFQSNIKDIDDFLQSCSNKYLKFIENIQYQNHFYNSVNIGHNIFGLAKFHNKKNQTDISKYYLKKGIELINSYNEWPSDTTPVYMLTFMKPGMLQLLTLELYKTYKKENKLDSALEVLKDFCKNPDNKGTYYFFPLQSIIDTYLSINNLDSAYVYLEKMYENKAERFLEYKAKLDSSAQVKGRIDLLEKYNKLLKNTEVELKDIKDIIVNTNIGGINLNDKTKNYFLFIIDDNCPACNIGLLNFITEFPDSLKKRVSTIVFSKLEQKKLRDIYGEYPLISNDIEKMQNFFSIYSKPSFIVIKKGKLLAVDEIISTNLDAYLYYINK